MQTRTERLGGAEATLIDRRRFIKAILLGGAASVLPGGPWAATLWGNVQPTQAGAGILRVNLEDFPVLQNVNGSVRLAINSFTNNGPNGRFYPVLINRGSADQIFALNARCTHQGCVIPTFGRTCPCHGSRFGIDGRAISGPASGPLTRYETKLEGNILSVEIPGLGYSVAGSLFSAATSDRFQITFDTFQNTEYEVRFTEVLTEAGRVVPFATVGDGPASAMSLVGNGRTATLFLDREPGVGFYVVSVKLKVG